MNSCEACGIDWDVAGPVQGDYCTSCKEKRDAFIDGFKVAAIRFHFSQSPDEEELDKWLTAMPARVVVWGGKTLEEQALACWQEHIAATKGDT